LTVGTDLYKHMPIQHVAHALADFGLLGEQSSQKCVIPYLGRQRTAEKNLTLLSLSSAEKSVSACTHKQKHSKRYIHTLPILQNKHKKLKPGLVTSYDLQPVK